MVPIKYDQSFSPASLKDMPSSIVDSLEGALAHYRKENKPRKLRELSKSTNNRREVRGSVNIDRAIRVDLPSFSAVWLKDTGNLDCSLSRCNVSHPSQSDEVDQLVHIHAEEHFNSFGNLGRRYLNTGGFGTFSTHSIPLKLPAMVSPLDH